MVSPMTHFDSIPPNDSPTNYMASGFLERSRVQCSDASFKGPF
jgi:hypothetical protein